MKMRARRVRSRGNGLILSRKEAISVPNVFSVQGRATHPHCIHCSVTSRTKSGLANVPNGFLCDPSMRPITANDLSDHSRPDQPPAYDASFEDETNYRSASQSTVSATVTLTNPYELCSLLTEPDSSIHQQPSSFVLKQNSLFLGSGRGRCQRPLWRYTEQCFPENKILRRHVLLHMGRFASAAHAL